MRLDHVSYACTPTELAEVVQRIGADLGAGFVDGGLHPRFGTRNFVLPLAGGNYVEVVAALDHPASDKAPFGRAVKSRAEAGGGWLGWAVSVDDMSLVEERLGRESVPGHRRRPDGVELNWRQIGVLDLIADPQLPFFTQWEVPPDQHPSVGGGPVSLDRLEICGEPARLEEWLGAPLAAVLDAATVEWVDAEEPGVTAVWFRTLHGQVRID